MSSDKDPAPSDEISFYGFTVSPDGQVPPAEPLPEPAAGFRFVRELGRGGMGVVYEAVEEAAGRHVAVKLMARRLVHSPDAVQRFQREARLAGSIAHPNCVFVYGAHDIHGAAAISMELMSGQSLEDRIKSGVPIPVEAAVRWTIEILDGLEAAHALGVVHRDVKPSNCFLTDDGRVKVGDFGLSRSIESDLGLTQSGAFLGSPLYASPEQVRGREVDRRSDVYSAGATLYALLAGRPPHSGSAIGDVLAQIVAEDPKPLGEIRPGVSRSLEGVVRRAMAKDPARRFQDCAAFRRALLPHAPGSLTPATLGLRIVAYMIDKSLASLVHQAGCLALYACGVRYASSLPGAPWMPGGMMSILGQVGVLFLWFSVLEWRFAGTPAKRLLGLRVVRTDGSHASLPRVTLRALLFVGPLEAPNLIFGMDAGDWPSLFRIVVFLVPLITMRKENGWRGTHELLSGTRVMRSALVFQTRKAGRLEEANLEPALAFPPVIGGYAVEGVVGSTERGTLLAAKDPGLDRSVWIHLAGAGPAPPGPDPSPSTRPAGLRWLRRGEGPRPFDVYESPGGAPLRADAGSRPAVPWPEALNEIQTLAEELDARGRGVAPEQLWLDRWGHVRVLDFGIGGRTPLAPHEVLAAGARSLLLGAPRSDALLPADLPMHADATVRRVIGLDPPFLSMAGAKAALQGLGSLPAVLTRSRRVAQLCLVGLWLFWVGLTIDIRFDAKATRDGTTTALAEGPWWREPIVPPLALLALYVVPSILLAFALGGGLTCSWLGIRIRDRRGVRASRLRCALRAAVACLPAVPALVALSLRDVPGWIRPTGTAVSAALYLAFAALAVVWPADGPADRIARTRLVRR